MKSIKVTILGRQYPLKVQEGDEQTMQQIAEYVDRRFQDFKTSLTTQSETTVMVLAALSIAEELFNERENRSGDELDSEELMAGVNASLEKALADIKRKTSDL